MLRAILAQIPGICSPPAILDRAFPFQLCAQVHRSLTESRGRDAVFAGSAA